MTECVLRLEQLLTSEAGIFDHSGRIRLDQGVLLFRTHRSWSMMGMMGMMDMVMVKTVAP